MRLKLISFQSNRSGETKTCEDCGFVSHIYLYELMFEVVSSDKHKVGSQHLIDFKQDSYIDKYMTNNERLWGEFLDENEVPECESFDEVTWINRLRKQYQRIMKAKSDERIFNLLNEMKEESD